MTNSSVRTKNMLEYRHKTILYNRKSKGKMAANISKRSPLVSILIPVYNTDTSLLTRSMNSVLSQSYQDIEVIIIDDGSAVECSRQCDAFALADSRVTVIHQINMGVSVARNVGLNHCNGDWVMFVDPDDELLQGSIEEAIELAEANDVDILYGTIEDAWGESRRSTRNLSIEENTVVICSDNKDLHDIAEYFITHIYNNDASLRLPVFTGPVAKLFKKSVAANVRFPQNVYVAEDNIYNSRAVLLAKRIGIVNHCWYRYWHRHGSALASLDFASVSESFCSYLRKYVTGAKLSDDSYYGGCCNIFFATLNSMASSGELNWQTLSNGCSLPQFKEAFENFKWNEYIYPKFSIKMNYRLFSKHHLATFWLIYKIWKNSIYKMQ